MKLDYTPEQRAFRREVREWMTGHVPADPLPSFDLSREGFEAHRRWERTLSAAQVAALKRDVRPGLKPGQRGLQIGDSGPYAVEDLRLAAGRRFGWTVWPSNACEGRLLADGAFHLTGHGWGHNAGLCLATARFRAANGVDAEQILAEAFPPSWRTP